MAYGTIQCISCGRTVTLDPDNSFVICYQKPVYAGRNPFQHIIASCPCGIPTRIFADNDDMQTAITAGCSTACSDYPDDEVIEGWYQAAGLHRLEPVEITKRMENEIAALGKWLDEAPAEWVLAVFEEPAPPHELPESWR